MMFKALKFRSMMRPTLITLALYLVGFLLAFYLVLSVGTSLFHFLFGWVEVSQIFVGSAAVMLLLGAYAILCRVPKRVELDSRGITVHAVVGKSFHSWARIESWSDTGMRRQKILLIGHWGRRTEFDVEMFDDPGRLFWSVKGELERRGISPVPPDRLRHSLRFDARPGTDFLLGLALAVGLYILALQLAWPPESVWPGSVLLGAFLVLLAALGLDRSHHWHRVKAGSLQRFTIFTRQSMPLDERVRALIKVRPGMHVVLIRGRKRWTLSPNMPGFGTLLEEVFDHLLPGQIEGDPGLLQEIPPPESPLPLESVPELSENA